jgi:hypothetical protein
MNWRDEFFQSPQGISFLVTAMDIVDDELDAAYCSNDTVHTIVDTWVSFGVKVGAA